MNGWQRLRARQIEKQEDFIARSLEIAERFSDRPAAEERFINQAIDGEQRLADFKAGRIDCMWPKK